MMTRVLSALFLALLLPVSAAAFDTRATAAWVYDVKSGTVLLDKNADAALPPASMSKLMTLVMLFEALRDGRITMQTVFPVSSRAKAMGGSTMFLNEEDEPTVEDLIRGIIINSGNDACVVAAEGLAGSEDTFARLMTERGRELGLTHSNFVNSTGWPAAGHVQSMRDLGIIARHIIVDFPEYYPFFAMTEFNYKDRAPANAQNRNPLLRRGGSDWKADGLKTGHTSEAGYGLVGSAVRGDRRVIFVVTGLTSDEARAEESESIVNWAFRQFVEKTVATKGTRLAEAEVFLGRAASVGLVPERDVTLLLPASGQSGVEARIQYNGPLIAPVLAGQAVAELVVTVPGMPETRVPVLAETDVARGGFFIRLQAAARDVLQRVAGADAVPAG
jgi:D-alanyl-D-alanine carboxypeptidase (penicillin-binding protein 5/6)